MIKCIPLPKKGLTVYLPAVVVRIFLNDLHICVTSLQGRRKSLCQKKKKKKKFNTISKPGSKLYGLFTALMKAGTTHAPHALRCAHFHWLGHTVLNLPSFHGVYYASVKLNFSNSEPSQLSCVYFLFFLKYIVCRVYCSIIILPMSIQPYGCKGNKSLSKIHRQPTI